jgi:murein DD-endopeptidase MepM/ murein hydrolase activator NlpD
VRRLEEIGKLRSKQIVLARREELLTLQLLALERERLEAGTPLHPALLEDIRRGRSALVLLLREEREAEGRFIEELRYRWEADGLGRLASLGERGTPSFASWPVEPLEGISAGFRDAHYEQLFGIAHEGLDIPTEQGTVVRAPEDGVVETVEDNGMGFSYAIVKHDGYATLYGHLSAFLVEEGQAIVQGEPIGLSGGRPGTRGAGRLTTGPHLHFEVLIDGEHRDPLPYLPFHVAVHGGQTP